MFVAVEGGAPNPLQQLAPAKCPARVTGQKKQQIELAQG